MTRKEQRKLEAERYRILRNEPLIDEDPEIWIERNGDEMSLGISMDDIHEYIHKTLWMDDNPLRHLRKYFPDFTWSYYEDVGRDKFSAILGAADYIWVTGAEVGDGFVTAMQIEGPKPRVLCFLSKTYEHSGWNKMIRKELRSTVPSIRFVEDGNDKNAGTIIS